MGWGGANKYIYYRIGWKYSLNNTALDRSFVYHVGGSGFENRFSLSLNDFMLVQEQGAQVKVSLDLLKFFKGDNESIFLPQEEETHTLNKPEIAAKISRLFKQSFTLQLN